MTKTQWLLSGASLAILVGVMPASAETLEQAMASAYQSNPTILGERSKLRATDELVPQALAGWRPTVTLSGNITRSNTFQNLGAAGSGIGGTTSGTPSGGQVPAQTANNALVYNNDTMGVQVTEAIYRGGRTTAQTRQAEAQIEAERAQLQLTEQQVMLNVATAYLNLVQAQSVLRLSINNEQVLQRQLDAVNDRFRVGEVTRTDVAQAQSRLSAAHADRTQSEGNLRTARAAYVQNVGHLPDQVDYPAGLPPLPASLQEAQTLATAQNPAIANAQSTYQAALEGIDLVAGELLPTVSVQGAAQRLINFDGPSTLENVAQATLQVSVPIYQQGQEYARLRAQKQTAGQTRSALDQSRRDVEDGIATSWEALTTGTARRASYNDQIKAAAVALEGVQRENQVGSRTVLDVLNAEQELLQAQVNEVQAHHDEILASYQLLNATGQLTAQYLSLPVDLYDPAAHYEEVHDKWVGFGDRPDLASEYK
jgi:outer membrane protein